MKRQLLTAMFCFCAIGSTAWAQTDLWIRDNVGDTGNEPNTTTSVFWASPDIGVSWPNPNSPLKPNPSGGAVNWVHVKVQNRGTTASNGTDKVHIYYSAASLGLSWSTQWINYTSSIGGCASTVFGDEIGSASVPPLAPGGTADVVIQWWAPDPTLFGCLSQPNHYCMIARIVPGITYTETTNIVYNTQYNNNIAWRNWYVVKLPPGPVNPPVSPATVIARNVKDVATTMTLRAAVADEANGNLFDNATVDIVVDDELFEKWQANGAQGENIEDQGNGTIRMMDANAWIGGIPMAAGETHQVGFRFTRTNEDFIGTAEIDMMQEDDGEITGGERFEVNFAPDDGADGLVTSTPDEPKVADGILVYPNPSQTEFTISSADKSAGYSVRMFDATGREVYSTKFSGEVKVSVENLPKGTYYIEMSNALAGTKTTKQIIVK